MQKFHPAKWLQSAHIQTLWSVFFRCRTHLPLRRERLELPDGDFLDLDWTEGKNRPIVLILHGLEGSSDSHYARGLLAAIVQRGWRGVVVHFRGCSGEPNRLRRGYCAGDTDDIAFAVDCLHQREPGTSLMIVGYSLGGNALLKWLGETGREGGNIPLQAAVAVSVPFLLGDCARRLDQSVSRLYQTYLLRALKSSYRAKFRSRNDAPVALDQLSELRNFYTFDDRVTAPLHGYTGVEDYYARASCRAYLQDIRIPTLILHAADDPFMFATTIPARDELSSSVQLEVSPNGGHVGFVTGSAPWRTEYWLERRIPDFLVDHF